MATTGYKSKFTGEQVDSVVEKVLNQKQQANLTKVTYQELKTLVANKELVPGCYYEMTDYKSNLKTFDNHITSINIILLALNNSTLSSEVSIVPKEGCKKIPYIIDGMQEYEGYKAYYSLNIIDTVNYGEDSTGQIYKMIDTKNNVEFCYDYLSNLVSNLLNNVLYFKFKNVKFGEGSKFNITLENFDKLYIHDITVGNNSKINIIPYYVDFGNLDFLTDNKTNNDIVELDENIINETEITDVQLKNIHIGNDNNIYLYLENFIKNSGTITDINGNKLQCKFENVTIKNDNIIYLYGYIDNLKIGNNNGINIYNYTKNVIIGNNNNNINYLNIVNAVNTIIKSNIVTKKIETNKKTETYSTTVYMSKDGTLMVVDD